MSPTFSSLRHRSYRLYWSSMFVSNIGTWMQRVAQDWLVLVVLGGGAQAAGITVGLQFLPFLLISPLGGMLADRFSKRRLLICTNAFLGLIGFTLGVLVLTDVAQIWHVWVLAFLLGTGTAVDNPARQAYVSELVGRDDVTNAVALNSASLNAARLIGPGIAGLLIAWIGTGWVCVINGVTFASPIIALIILGSGSAAMLGGRAKGDVSRLRDGLAYIRSRPDVVMILLVVFGLGTFGMNFQLTTALMATAVFDMGPGEYGLLGSILAIGTLGGSLLAARQRHPRRRVIIAGAVVFGTLEALSGLAPTYTVFALSLIPTGIVALVVVTTSNAYVQLTVPVELRGRVMALYYMVFMGATPFGAPTIGWVAHEFGARWSLIGGGSLTALTAIGVVSVLARRNGIAVRGQLRPRPRLVVSTPAEEPVQPPEPRAA